MIDHASFGASNLVEAARLYERLFAPLGYERTRTYPGMVSFGSGGTEIFWLYPVDADRAIPGLGTHIAFSAPDPEAIEAAHRIALEEGLDIRRPPGRRPEVGPSYYGMVLADRDGNGVEMVAYTPPDPVRPWPA